MTIEQIIIGITILILITLQITTAILTTKLLKLVRPSKKLKIEEPNVVNTLANKKLEDDLVIERDKDLVLIDEYVSYIKIVIDKYNRSRNKKLAYRTRQELNLETFKVVPIVSKYIDLNYYYNLDDADWYAIGDKELMKMLESTYNDYTHDNLDSVNSLISICLRLRDEKR